MRVGASILVPKNICGESQHPLIILLLRGFFHAMAVNRSVVRGLLRGKTACITGGTTGIGRAIALEYVRQGANVAVNHLDLPSDDSLKKSMVQEAADLKRHCKPGDAIGDMILVAGDITDPGTGSDLVKAAVDAWGKLDICVSNAGIFKPAAFLE